MEKTELAVRVPRDLLEGAKLAAWRFALWSILLEGATLSNGTVHK